MITAIKNLYYAEDLNGELFLQPLKNYSSFFAKKIEHSAGLQQTAWHITHLATGLFAYPFFGALAGFGLCVKLFGISSVKQHNEAQKKLINSIGSELKLKMNAKSIKSSREEFISQEGWTMHVVKEFKLDPSNLKQVRPIIKKQIEKLTNQFKKVYVSSSTQVSENSRETTVQLKIRQQIQNPAFESKNFDELLEM